MHFVVSSAVRRLAGPFSRLAALLALPAAFAADYPVTAASPENINFANANLQPGDTIRLEAHTRSKLVLENITQGTPENPIIITNTGGQFVIDNTTGDKGLHFYNCRNIVVRGTPSPGNYDYGIKIAQVSIPNGIGLAFIQGSTDFEVTNVEIANVGFAGLMAKSDNLKGSSGFVMRNVRIHGLYIHDVGAEGIYVGSSFYHVTDTASPNYDPHEIHNVQIYNNTITNAGWDGIQLGCATQGRNAIHDNRIVGYGTKAGADAGQDEGIRSNPGTAADIYNNWIEGDPLNSGTGIFANPYNSVKYYNNVIVRPQESGIFAGETAAARGYVAGYSVRIFNNTFIEPKAYGVDLNNLSHSSGNLVQNTLTAAPGTDDIFLNNTVATETNNVLVPTLAAAGFVDAAGSDYRLTAASPALDAGLDFSALGLAADFDGVTRPVGAGFDAGAYERVVFGPGAPVITEHPAGRLVVAGGNVSFSATINGDAPLAYQWRKNGLSLTGATGATLALSAVQTADAADYSVTVTNAGGSVTSDSATLMVVAVLPPVITTQPAAQSVVAGGGVSFTVAASGTAPFSYQWQKNGVPLAGAIAATLTLANIQAADAGTYAVTVANTGGTVTSNGALLTVIAPPSSPTTFAAATIASDATVAGPVNPANTFTHAINIGANTAVTVNGVAFGFGTGNGGGAQPAKNYTFSTFNNSSSTFVTSATGDIKTLLTTRSTHTSSASYSLTLSGLTPGRRYGFALFTDSAHGVGRNWYRVGQNVDAVTMNVDFSAAGAAASRMLTATYTATASSITFTFTRLDGMGLTNTTGWVGFAGFVNYELAESPQITTPPAGQTVAAGAAATFAVVASGSSPLTYQWLKDGSPIAGATGPSFTLVSAQFADAGGYSVTATNPLGSATSAPAVLTVTAPQPVAPAITVQPANRTTDLNLSATFTVAATGTAPLAYQWSKDGAALAGATAASLVLTAVQPSAAGSYTVTVSNVAGSVTSNPATLTVNIPRQTAQRATVAGQFDFNYLLYLPTGYAADSGPEWPLLVFLHGYGERSTTEADPMDPVHLNKLRTLGPPKRIEGGTEFPCLVVSPQCSGDWWSGAQLEQFITELQQRYRIDRTRIMLTGLSMGGFGTFDLAQRNPSRYAAIAPMSAAPQLDAGNLAAAPGLRDLPLWTFIGANDPLFSVTALQNYLDVIRTAGGNPLLTVYTTPPGNGHDAWVPAYNDDALYAWLLGQSAQPPVVTTPSQATTITLGGSVTLSVAVSGRWPFTYQWTKQGAPIAGATTDTLTLANAQFADAGEYAVTVTNGVGSTTSAPATVTVTKIPAIVTLQDLAPTYDGQPKAVGVTTAPAGLSIIISYDGGPAAPVNAGSYAVFASIEDANYMGNATGTLEIGRATPQLGWNAPAAITYGTALGATQLNATASVDGSFVYSPAAGTVLGAGPNQPLGVAFSPLDAGNFNPRTGSTAITVNQAPASLTLSGLIQTYDGQPKPVTGTTTPAGLAVKLTYSGSVTPPLLPGTYAVAATVDDANHTGSAAGELVITIAALVRHAPVLNGAVDGSVQILQGENLTLNGSAWVAGDLLVPGTPALQFNGQPTFGGTVDHPGAAAPSDYTITLNGHALLGRLARRTAPIALPAVTAPAAPAGTTSVVLNNSSQTVADWPAVRHLTLNGNAGQVAVPPGAYGSFTANGGNSFLLGLSGATEPAVYDLQELTLNGSSTLRLAGPVIVTLAGGTSLNGSAGSAEHPDWLTLRLHSGDLTLNGSVSLHGRVIVPTGTVTLNGNSTLTGTVSADRLTINGNGLLTHRPDGS